MNNLREAAQEALEALTAWDALIEHQFSGTRVGMSDLTHAAQATPKVMETLRVALEQPDITITGTYEEFIEFVRMACMHETIYEDSEGRDILVIRVLDAYGMAHSWALEHTRNNLS